MSFFRKTLFWFIVLIGLAGALFFFDEKQETIKQAKEADLKLLPFAPEDVTEFWIGGDKDQPRIKVIRAQEGWQLTLPLSAKGDEKSIEKFLTNIITARKDAVLFTQAEPAKLRELGFGADVLKMGLKAGGTETIIVFGEKGPTNNVAYVMFMGRPDVYRVHSDLKKEASLDVYALRDKTILDFDPTKMRRLEIARKGAPRVVIEQDQGKWNMLAPTKGRASMTRVLELLYAIRNGEIKAFTEENPITLDPYGLSSPMLQVTIHQEQKDLPYILIIGDKDRAKRGYFARTNLVKKVFDVEEDLVNAILLNVDQLPEAGPGK